MNTENTSGNAPQPAADTPAPPVLEPPPIHAWVPAPAAAAPHETRAGHRKAAALAFLILATVLALFVGCVVGLTGYFRLSSPTAALRSSVMSAVPGPWDKTVALRVGWFTTGLIRAGSRFFEMPPEPRAALEAVHGAEVGVYKLQRAPVASDFKGLFATADQAMKRRGWDRIVGVAEEGQFVAVYFPHRKVSLRGIKCCVLVLKDRDLVVASASGNLEPLLKIAEEHINTADLRRCLPKGI